MRLALTDAGPVVGATLSESAGFCPTRCVVLLCRRSEEPLRPIREPRADASTVFADPGMLGRGAGRVDPFAFATAFFEDPLGAGKKEMSGSREAMLAGSSSKLIAGRKSKDPEDWEVSRLLEVAVGAKLNLEVLLIEDCLEWGSFWALDAKVRCEAGGFERPLWANLGMSTSILKLKRKAREQIFHTALMETFAERWMCAKLSAPCMYDPEMKTAFFWMQG